MVHYECMRYMDAGTGDHDIRPYPGNPCHKIKEDCGALFDIPQLHRSGHPLRSHFPDP